MIKNIYYMLTYAFSTLRRREYQDVAAEPFENIHDLFAAILAKGIGRQLKQGLYRTYVPHQDDLMMLRGKINISKTMNLQMSRKIRVACEFDELSENNVLNQILKSTALSFVQHSDVSAKYRKQLRMQLLFFSEIDTVELSTVHWSALRFKRHNQSYRTLMGFCQLIAEGMLLSTNSGQMKLASFVDDQRMSKLYERFVLEYYKRHFPELRPRAPHIGWSVDDDMDSMLPRMETDIVLRHDNAVLIIDTKYYSEVTQSRFDSRTLRSDHLYQIFTYVKNAAEHPANAECEVAGMLLYARPQADVLPDKMYSMSGNRIGVKHLDLNQDFANVASQLDSIAREYFPEAACMEQ